MALGMVALERVALDVAPELEPVERELVEHELVEQELVEQELVEQEPVHQEPVALDVALELRGRLGHQHRRHFLCTHAESKTWSVYELHEGSAPHQLA